VSDVFGPLRGLLILAALAAFPVLVAGVIAAIKFVVPLIPDLGGQFAVVNQGVDVLASVSAVALGFLLWPAVSMMIGGAMFDFAAEKIEKTRFPEDPPGRPPNFLAGLGNGLRIAIPALGLNLLFAPLLLIPPLALPVFFLLNATLMSREYFLLAATRFRSFKETKALRKEHGRTLLAAGLTCALLLYFPLLNFIAPLYGAALMVRLNKAMGA
jgi:CysZ protein